MMFFQCGVAYLGIVVSILPVCVEVACPVQVLCFHCEVG